MSEPGILQPRSSAPVWPPLASAPPAGVALSDWRDWGWQMRHRIRSADALREWIDPTHE